MSGDYLWDRTGPPDAELARLERDLGALAWKPAPSQKTWPVHSRRSTASQPFLIPLFALAAAIVILLGFSWRYRSAERPGLLVTRVSGTPEISARPIQNQGKLAIGRSLETTGGARATIDIGGIGQVNVEPDSRVTLVGAGSGDYRLRLDRGTLHALIWAPPGQFFVETQSATAVDLGCAFTISVDGEGIGTVRVTSGWVGFEWRGHESFIPAGATATTRPGLGPGIPHYEDTSDRFQHALVLLDLSAGSQEQRAAALHDVLTEARERDSVTLWHLLSRVEPQERDRVFDALARLVPPPSGVTRDGIRAANRQMLDAWWDALGLGTTSWWRTWKQPWREPASAR
jgi:FecR protein